MPLPIVMRLLYTHVSRSLGTRRLFSGVAVDKEWRTAGSVEAQKLKSAKRKGQTLSKLQREDVSWEERLSDAVTPLWRLRYEDQLEVKYDGQKKVLQMLSSRFKEISSEESANEQFCCPLHPIVPSPVINGYRNKSTFSVNSGPDGDPKTVGYYVRDSRAKNIICVRGNHLENLPEKHKQVAQFYEEFIKLSPLDPCLLFHEGGHWREISVRTNNIGHTMAIITFHPQELSQKELCVQKESLKEFFTHGPGSVCNLTSLYFQESTMTRCPHEQSPYQLLYGEPHIFEEVLGQKFRISPDAFFQINTTGAEVLYKTIASLSHVDRNTVLLDVCCGTGISNCQFHSGKAEVVLPQLLLSLQEDLPLTAVVNPSRSGLHYHVTRAIRNCRRIQSLVYVSCKPEGEAQRNFLELCCPPNAQKKLLGEPFKLERAVPVDMFPHTNHCELVLLFER
ncbi:tRNA (uracil-5-)-methyltransferase homolog B isoform X2 [Ambystoma mexicanum]|uniref:tRNA (uracil-5-)-methyltransferase homolog B isoform X2 n=1 Tax=Ambystoma mexicanum TaxID=8296 RepID=UPI0037E8BB27